MPDVLVLLIILLVLVVIWRGPRTLPEIGRMLGRGVRNAREEARSMRNEGSDTSDKTGQ
jgi:Sec-independent protein translocase protein TatA